MADSSCMGLYFLVAKQITKRDRMLFNVDTEICKEVMRSFGGTVLENKDINDLIDPRSNHIIFKPFKIEYKVKSSMNDGDGIYLQRKSLVAKKLNAKNSLSVRNIVLKIFKKDCLISKYAMEAINIYLKKVDTPVVKYPAVIYNNLFDIGTCGELIIIDNVDAERFELHDANKDGMNFDCASSVMETYARLHAGFQLLESNGVNCESICAELIVDKLDASSEKYLFLKKSIEGLLDSSIKIIGDESELKDVCSWIKFIKGDSASNFVEMFKPTKKFRTFSHCNMGKEALNLRYHYHGEHGEDSEAEVCLSGFGGSMISSPAIDLNNIFFTCLSSELRREKLDGLLSVYYSTYSRILMKGNLQIPFTLTELQAEVRTKMFVAWFSAINLICSDVSDSNESSYRNCNSVFTKNKVDFDDFMKDNDKELLKLFESNEKLKNKFLDLYKDLEFFGVTVRI